MCLEAEALAPGTQSLTWKFIATIHKARGRLEESIQALEHSTTIAIGHIPAHNRRVVAASRRELATLHAELGRGDIALALIAQTEPDVAGDEKQQLLLDGDAALVHAFRGERDLARQRMGTAIENRKRVPDDRLTRQSLLISLARTALLIEETDLAEFLLHEFAALQPEPISLTFLYYHLAECRRQRGDEQRARELYKQAAATHFGIRWEHLAQERLDEESRAGTTMAF
jgi:tetratricopeptide (TPR) repeat protein